MQYKTIITDDNLLEQIQYPDGRLPISFYQDSLDDFLNGEVGFHWHDDFEFGFILQGEIECHIHQRLPDASKQSPVVLKAGDGMFINSRSLHWIRQVKPHTILPNFVVPANLFSLSPMREVYQQNILPLIRAPISGLYLLSERETDNKLLHVIKEIYNLDIVEIGYELHCIELLCRLWRLLLTRILQTGKQPPAAKTEFIQEERMRRMLSYIHTHYTESMTADRIARSANISRSECFRCFRTIMGISPSEYLCQYRLSQAAHLLLSTDRPISDICFSCGFKSTSYFGKVFREKCGLSPGQYRKNA